MPQRLTSKDEFRTLLDRQRAEGRTIGVVGTSGGLHAGHLSLVERSIADGNFTVLWLFTSGSAGPYIEAGPLPQYDRDYDRDERVAMEAGIDVLFRPPREVLFPQGSPLVRLQVAESLAEPWPGSDSAEFVNMVAMMVGKELNVVGPCRLYCGEKDWQNAAVLRRMVADLSVPAEIVPCPTVRGADGVVLGSRNVKLLPEERARAVDIKPALDEAAAAIEAVVTGGSRGIGRAIVQRLAEEGASVMFTGRNPETGLGLEKTLRDADLTVRFVVADSAREADVRRAVESTIETFGGLNTVCHNAAATDQTGPGRPDSHVAEIDEDAIDALFGTAVKGAFWAAKYAVRHMREHGGGALINISAASSTLAMKGRPAYQASKGALNALTRQLAVDYGPDKIRANAVIVGFIDTGSDVMKRLTEGNGRFITRVRELIVLPRLGAPADIANGVLYLASDEGSYVTGVLLPIDGGYTCHLNVGDSASIQTYQP